MDRSNGAGAGQDEVRPRRGGWWLGAGLFGVALLAGGLSLTPTGSTKAAPDLAYGYGTEPSDSLALDPTADPGPPPAAPTLALTCPADSGGTPVFAHAVSATTPYVVTIEYGDGQLGSGWNELGESAFTHTYAGPGTYTVNAVVTDSHTQQAAASCVYEWGVAKKAPAKPRRR